VHQHYFMLWSVIPVIVHLTSPPYGDRVSGDSLSISISEKKWKKERWQSPASSGRTSGRASSPGLTPWTRTERSPTSPKVESNICATVHLLRLIPYPIGIHTVSPHTLWPRLPFVLSTNHNIMQCCRSGSGRVRTFLVGSGRPGQDPDPGLN
jgi:hypothetical protein